MIGLDFSFKILYYLSKKFSGVVKMFNSLTRTTALFFGIVHILTRISPENIKVAIDNLEADEVKKQLFKSSIINPIFGYLFESTGALGNIRFFGPNLKFVKK
jgi:hypothetical protein